MSLSDIKGSPLYNKIINKNDSSTRSSSRAVIPSKAQDFVNQLKQAQSNLQSNISTQKIVQPNYSNIVAKRNMERIDALVARQIMKSGKNVSFGVPVSRVSIEEFRRLYPDAVVPSGVENAIRVSRSVGPEGVKDSYRYEFSPEAQYKMKLFGSVDNYDKYLDIVRSHPELVALYNISGGTGVGPLGIVPSMGVDLAMQSNRPGVAGASEREETIMKWVDRIKGGNPDAGPSVQGAAMHIIENPFVQIAATEAIFKAVPYIVKGAMKLAPRAGRVIMPGGSLSRNAFNKIVLKSIKDTEKLAKFSFKGARGLPGRYADSQVSNDIFKTQVMKNFLKWAKEGHVPVGKTSTKVSEDIVAKLSRSMKTGDIRTELDVKDVNRLIQYKPMRRWGFQEREFVSKATQKRYLDLLKKGRVTEANTIMRGEADRFAQLQVIAERSGYRKGLLPGSRVYHPYRSSNIELRLSRIPRYEEDLMISPKQKLGSLYNLNRYAKKFVSDVDEAGPGSFLTRAADKNAPRGMKNIWAGRRWNPVRRVWEDQRAIAQLGRQQRLMSLEEEAVIRNMRRVGVVTGKGSTTRLAPEFMIPEERLGSNSLALLGIMRGARETVSPQTDLFFRPERSQRHPPVLIRVPIEVQDQGYDVIRVPIKADDTVSAYDLDLDVPYDYSTGFYAGGGGRGPPARPGIRTPGGLLLPPFQGGSFQGRPRYSRQRRVTYYNELLATQKLMSRLMG